MSATSLSSRCKSLSSTTSQSSANAGACLVLEQKCAFQKPHFHHFATNSFILWSLKSERTSHDTSSLTIVHTGTCNTKSGAFAPCINCFPPRSHFSALSTFLCIYSERVLIFSFVCRKTCPPSPPSHHRGPHFGIYFSLLHETRPSHHFQEITLIFTSSTNIFL